METLPGYDAWKLRGPDDDRDDCSLCNGTGKADSMNCGGDGEVDEGIECPACEGEGTVECTQCDYDEHDGDYEFERRRDAAWEDI